MLEAYRRYAEFSGRSRREELWWYLLASVLMALAAIMVDVALFDGADTLSFAGVSGPVYLLFAVLNFVPGLAVQVRRLHDTGKSGWWWLLVLVPFINLYVLFVMLFQPGQDGPNAYGPSRAPEPAPGNPPAAAPPPLPAALHAAAPEPEARAPVIQPQAPPTPASNAGNALIAPPPLPPPLPPRQLATAAPSAPSLDATLERLEQLARLKAAGVLTDEELAAQKARILGTK